MSLDISIDKTPSIRRAVFTDCSKIWPGLLFRPVHCERGDIRGHFLHHLWRRREGVQEKFGPWGRDQDSVPWRLLRGTGKEDETSTPKVLVSCSEIYFQRSETDDKLSQSWLWIDFNMIWFQLYFKVKGVYMLLYMLSENIELKKMLGGWYVMWDRGTCGLTKHLIWTQKQSEEQNWTWRPSVSYCNLMRFFGWLRFTGIKLFETNLNFYS